MGASYKTARTYLPGQSLFIAAPAYECVKPGFAYSLALTTAELVRHGIPFELALMEGNCHVDDGRNSLVRDFLEGSCTDMIFIDADVMWSAKDVLKMLTHKDELVCGAYPKKCTPQTYPIGRILNARHDGMLEVSYAPTGFMRIKRSVFEKLWPLQAKAGKERPTAVFFERRFNGPSRDGGDVTFCRKWIAAGGKVVVDPHLVLSHIGENRWTGRFLDYLAKDENRSKHMAECKDPLIDKPQTHYTQAPSMGVPFWIEKIRSGDISQETFQSLADAYGNKPWAATWDFHLLAYQMALQLPADAVIYECGCGLSTIVLAATGRSVLAIEEQAEWAEKTDLLLKECGLDANILVSPVSDDWYMAKGRFKSKGADMLVIDGPKRRDGVERLWPLRHRAVKAGGAVLIDDVLSVDAPGEFIQCGTEERQFVAGRLGEKT